MLSKKMNTIFFIYCPFSYFSLKTKNTDPKPKRKTLNQSGIYKPNIPSRTANGTAPPQEQKPKKARG